ncbi:hypothetical protein FB639_004621 [Coemansia asiatica]|nr:hypothetical protein FB639_004621 [Coemansia asiatica]
MNYFNKALEQFDTNLVTPIYYVFFTSATILASVALFQGFTDSTNKELASLFCGFITIFIGVFLLNSTKSGCSSPSGGQHQPLPTEEPGRVSYSRGRAYQSAASFDLSDFDDFGSNGSSGNHQSFPMHERRNTLDSEKRRSLSKRHTLPKKNRASERSSCECNDGGETTEVPSSSSRSNSGNFAPVSPASLPNDDVHIDIPLSPLPPLSGGRRRQQMPFGRDCDSSSN